MLAQTSTAAAGPQAPLSLQAKIFFKLATYDSNLPPVAEGVTIGVFHDAASSKQMAKIFGPLRPIKLKGRSLDITIKQFDSVAGVKSFVAQKKPYALFLHTSLSDNDISALAALAHKSKLMIYSTNPSDVEQGLSAGVEVADNKPRIVINIRSAMKSGRQYQGGLLQVARVIK